MNNNAARNEYDLREERVVLFDGVCKLCSAWAHFLIRFDTQKKFKLATVQSDTGQAVLRMVGLPTDHYETMVLLDKGKLHTQSTAFLQIVSQLPLPWPLLSIGWMLPRFIRDWLYDRIALNRYRLFGKYDYCMLPSEEHKTRFLE